MTEDDKDKSWGCTKVLQYSEEKEVNGNTSYNYFVEWNNMNKSQSLVNFFPLSLISFARKITICVIFPSFVTYYTASLNHQQLFQRHRRFQLTQQVLSTNSESKSTNE
jgi:hypothetical protein